MQALKRKATSQRGASITFALLLFLVCAVASSVIIVAATAASGRMKNIPEIDQRYYAVSSAAELLRAELDEAAISVVEETKTTTLYEYTSSGALKNKTVTQGTPETAMYPVENPTPSSIEASPSILTDIVNTLALSDDSASTLTFPVMKTLNLTASGAVTLPQNSTITSDLALTILNVKIYEQYEKNGTLTFYVSKSAQKATDAYTIKLTFAAEKTENTVTHTDHGSPVVTDTGYTITDKETTKTTTVFKWTLNGVAKSTVPLGFPS